jgi:hypothetical protein
VPERQKSIPTEFAEATQAFQDDLAPRVAALMRPVLGNVPVSKDERRRRWWQEEKGWTPEKEQQLLASGMSREDVGLLRFPNREIDARAAGHGDVRKEAEYARDMSALGPPPPEPLEAAALALETEEEAGSQAQPSLGVEAVASAPEMAPSLTLPAELAPFDGTAEGANASERFGFSQPKPGTGGY